VTSSPCQELSRALLPGLHSPAIAPAQIPGGIGLNAVAAMQIPLRGVAGIPRIIGDVLPREQRDMQTRRRGVRGGLPLRLPRYRDGAGAAGHPKAGKTGDQDRKHASGMNDVLHGVPRIG